MSELESLDVVCSSCGNNSFEVRYEENYCECGEAFRLFCVDCRAEQDWHANGNLRGIVEFKSKRFEKKSSAGGRHECL